MLVLGLDFETTGLDLANDLIIEIGAVLWETDEAKPVKLLSTLVLHEHAETGEPPAPLRPEITRITGITDQDLYSYGLMPKSAFNSLFDLMDQAEYVVAHNGKGFDKPMLESECARQAWDFPERPWLDTDHDIPYPPHISTRKLTFLATEHGFLNPFAHRAVFDVLTMLRVLSHYDFNKVLAYSKEPSVTLRIVIPAPWEDGGEGNTKAKGLGYRWDGAAKQWRKTVKQNQAPKETAEALPYKVNTVS